MPAFLFGLGIGTILATGWVWLMMAFLTKDDFTTMTPFHGTLLIPGIVGVTIVATVITIFLAEEP